MHGKILIVDDQVTVYRSLARNFKYAGYQTAHAQTRQEALELASHEAVQVVLLDIMLGQEHGLDILKELLLLRQNLPVIMITGYGSIDTAVQAMKSGAVDYVTKPLNFENLLKLVENALSRSSFQSEPHAMKVTHRETLPHPLTQNKRMEDAYRKARKLAATDLPVLITGEDGTGKELVADFIHAYSPRNSRKMVKINCAAFPETLLDNELFGHEKGAYTGADTTFKGVFERADQSSLFLDEIGDMPLTIQAKILRTLQNHEIRRIGGEQTITVNVRFIVATNKDLSSLIEKNLFRKDLFYRLNTAMIHLPPLRERKEDIPLFVDFFLADYGRNNATMPKNVSPTVMERFLDYDWPGNVRELKNTVNYAAALSSASAIELDDLPPYLSSDESFSAAPNVREEFEKTLILKMLQKADNNKRKAAELLNMSRNTLYNKLQKYGITL